LQPNQLLAVRYGLPSFQGRMSKKILVSQAASRIS
jgi:hypothetical protein